MGDEYTIRVADYIVHKYGTRNALDIISNRYICLRFTSRCPKLRGYYCAFVGQRFIGINENISEQMLLEVAQHELGHDVFDYLDAVNGKRFQDAYFYSFNANDKRERRANLFSSEVGISDEDVLEPIGYRKYREIYDMERERFPHARKEELEYLTAMEFDEICGSDFPTLGELASDLNYTEELLSYKLKCLDVKGYDLPINPELKANYLKL